MLHGLVQAGGTWNDELNGLMEGVGYTVVAKDLAVYAKNSWNQVDGGFRVEHFVGIDARKELDTSTKSVDAKYGITGFGEGRAC